MADTEITTPSIPSSDVAEFIRKQIVNGGATKVVATKTGSSWTVVITRPTVGRLPGPPDP